MFSETRFVEIMEHVCKKSDDVDTSKFDSLKDLQFKVGRNFLNMLSFDI